MKTTDVFILAAMVPPRFRQAVRAAYNPRDVGDLDRLVSRILTATVLFAGLWTAVVQLTYLVAAPFVVLLFAFPIILCGTILAATRFDLFARVCRASISAGSAPAMRSGSRLDVALLLLGLGCTAIAAVSGGIFAAAALAIFATAIIARVSRSPAPETRIKECQSATGSGNDALIVRTVAALAIGAGLFSLFVYRPDADDAFYMSLASTAVETPYSALHSMDGLLGGERLKLGAWYGLHSYEALAAVLATVLDVQPYAVAHNLLGPLLSAIAVLAIWRVLRSFLMPTSATVGLTVTIAVICLWGEAHRTYGNFGFVRMFQGKAQFATLWVPILVLFAASFVGNGRIRNIGGLLLALFASVGATSTALFIGPMAAAMAGSAAFLSARAADATFRLAVLVLLLSAFIVVSLLLHLPSVLGGAIPQLGPGPAPASDAVVMFGGEHRYLLALIALVALPAVATTSRAALFFALYLAICAVWFWTPISSALLQRAPSNLLWRSAWAVPMPLLIGLAIGFLWARFEQTPRSLRASVVVAFLAVFAWPPNSWTFSKSNLGVIVAWPVLDRDPHLAAVAEITERTGLGPEHTVLAPEELAWRFAAWRGAPRPQIPRLFYARWIAMFDPSLPDRGAVQSLWNCFNRGSCNQDQLREQIHQRQPDMIVLGLQDPASQSLEDVLEGRYRRFDFDPYRVWVRSVQAQEVAH